MSWRRTITISLCLMAALAACSVSETIGHPSCFGDGHGDASSGLIAAQSVPTATLLPCFDDLPAGWEVNTVDITQAGTTVVIDSDRAGFTAASLRYLSECDVGDAIATPSDDDRTERFELIRQVSPRFQEDRFYLFEGGCIWWNFDFDVGVPSAMSVELENSLQLIDRDDFNDGLRESFVDEDL
jgi:hypothetical protein